VLFPFYWQFLTSLKQPVALTDLSLFPNFETASLRSYVFIFQQRNFGKYLYNSFMIASITTLFGITVSSFAAYAVARLKFKGKAIFLGMILSVSMFPQIAILSPMFIFMRNMGLRNTWAGLIIPYMTFSMPLSLWYLSSFFKTIPQSLEEAAKIDGCTPLQSFIRVIAPLALPGIFTAAILVFITAWNEYLFALTINTEDRARTMPVGITMFQGEFTIPWVETAAAIISVTIPLAIVVLIFQQRIISGLTTGAVKG
jgi:multiple sugar transport system permease protein